MRAKKLRWYRVGHDTDLRRVADSFQALGYSDDEGAGFEILDLKDRSVLGRYIERQVVKLEIRHPFGDVDEITSVKYVSFDFEIIEILSARFLLKIESPPASIKGFVARLAELFGMGFSISAVTFDIVGVLNYLEENETLSRYEIPKVSASSITLGKSSTAKVELTSSGNAYSDLSNEYGPGGYRLDKVLINARIHGDNEVLEIARSGLASSTPGFQLLMDDYVKDVAFS